MNSDSTVPQRASADKHRPGWIDLGPIEPTPADQVPVLAREVYVGPTLEDVREFTKARQR